MSTVNPSEIGKLRQFAVAFRSESRVWVGPGESWAIPWRTKDGRDIRLAVSSHYEAFDDSQSVASLLVFRSITAAHSVNEALLIAQLAASQAADVIAFIHNAYVAPPLQWYAFEMEGTSDWRFIKQNDYESMPPQVTRLMRRYRPDLAGPFFSLYGRSQSPEDFLRVHRSLVQYSWVLENWSISVAYRAAHYLYMAAEALEKMALRSYAQSEGKSEAEMLEPFLIEAKSKEVTIPKGATKEERETMIAMYARLGAPGYRGTATGMLKTKTFRSTIFKSCPDVFNILKEATDGFEHGHMDFREINQRMIPVVDRAAACVRQWILKQLVADQQLLAQLIAGDLALPLVMVSCTMMCKAEFRWRYPIPLRDANTAPFQIKPVPGGDFPGTLDVQSSMLPEVEIRNLGSGFAIPSSTIEEQSRASLEALEVLMDYESPSTSPPR